MSVSLETSVCVCGFIYIYVWCMHCTCRHKYITDPCLRQEETNMITAGWHIILGHYDESYDNLTSITNSRHMNIFLSPICSLSHIVFLSKQELGVLHAQPVQACVGTYNIVWWCLIHLFLGDEIFECGLQNINVTSFLTELIFTQMLKF